MNYVTYNFYNEHFEIISKKNGDSKEAHDIFDRCVWAGGKYSKAHYPKLIQDMLVRENFTVSLLHSTQVNYFYFTAIGEKIIFVEYLLSAEDLAPLAVKLGAEKIYIYIRSGECDTTYMAACHIKDQIFKDILPCRVNKCGSVFYYHQVELYEETIEYKQKEGSKIIEISNISDVVLLTGYIADVDYLEPELMTV